MVGVVGGVVGCWVGAGVSVGGKVGMPRWVAVVAASRVAATAVAMTF